MVRLILFFALFAGLLGGGSVFAESRQSKPFLLQGYVPKIGVTVDRWKPHLVLREWEEQGQKRWLVVEPNSLRTSSVRCVPGIFVPQRISDYCFSWFFAEPDRSVPAFVRLWNSARKNESKLQNAGITHLSNPAVNALTFDLCPSSKPLDRFIFDEIASVYGRGVPAFLQVSGRWIASHSQDFQWLIGQSESGRLNLVWVNHSETHPYDDRLEIDRTFLLTAGVDLDAELERVEQRLLAAGIVPSVFFRFPGLVSSQEIFERVLNRGLIPLGSSAWLAKNQPIGGGDVVLLHANGNEESGLKKLHSYFLQHRKAHWGGLESL